MCKISIDFIFVADLPGGACKVQMICFWLSTTKSMICGWPDVLLGGWERGLGETTMWVFCFPVRVPLWHWTPLRIAKLRQHQGIDANLITCVCVESWIEGVILLYLTFLTCVDRWSPFFSQLTLSVTESRWLVAIQHMFIPEGTGNWERDLAASVSLLSKSERLRNLTEKMNYLWNSLSMLGSGWVCFFGCIDHFLWQPFSSSLTKSRK